MPENRVACRFTGGSGSDDVTHKCNLVAFLAECGDCVKATLEAGFAHGQGVQRDVRAAPGVAGRGEVVGVDLAVHLENLDLDGLGHPFAMGEPFSLGPGLEDLGGGSVLAGGGQLGNLIKGIIHQGDAGQGAGSFISQLLVLQRTYQRSHVVAADHGAEQTDGCHGVDQRGLLLSADDLGQELGLYLCCRVNTRRNAVGNQIEQKFFFALGRFDQQFAQVGGLLGCQRQRGNALLGAFLFMGEIGFDHSYVLLGGVWVCPCGLDR